MKTLVGLLLAAVTTAIVLHVLWPRWNAWRLAKVRFLVQWGPKPLLPYHITLTPRLGFSIPWFGGGTKRLRWAPHHGVQVVEWTGTRWVVRKQVFGRSKVSMPTKKG